MNSRPILFSPAMVRAILSGNKTQTRRIIKPQPRVVHGFNGGWLQTNQIFRNGATGLRVPFGLPGDQLWVRETWKTCKSYDSFSPSQIDSGAAVKWLSDESSRLNGPEEWGRTRVSIHMPRWASRLILTITDIRVQRLQDIREEDAEAEGVRGLYFKANSKLAEEHFQRASDAYRHLWNSINGPDSWDANPYVWVISFSLKDQAPTPG